MIIFILITFIIFAAFFAGSEIAFTSLDKIKLKSNLSKKHRNSLLLMKLKRNPAKVINILLIGTNISIITASSLLTFYFKNIFKHNAELYATIIMSTAVLLFSEMIPKIIFRNYPFHISITLAPVWNFLYYLFLPVQFILEKLSMTVIRLMKMRNISRTPLITKKGLIEYLRESVSSGVLTESYTHTIDRLSLFSNIVAKDIMTPLNEVYSLKKNCKIIDAIEIMKKTGLAKFAVFDENNSNPTGYINIREILKYDKTESITKFIKKAAFIPESKKISKLFMEFGKLKSEIVYVIDEYGSTSGIITATDIIRKVLGEIEFLTKEKSFFIKIMADNSILINAKMSIDEFNKSFNVNIPKLNYNTITGFIEHILKKIPENNEEFRYKNILFRIINADERTIKTISVKIIKNGKTNTGPQISIDMYK